MKKLSILILLFVSFCLTSGCITEKYVRKTQTVPPHRLGEEAPIQKESVKYADTLEPQLSKQDVKSVKDVPAPVRTASQNEKDTDDKYPSSHELTASKYETELQTGLKFLSQKKCSEAIDLFSSLIIRYPEETTTQYYLSFAYDTCGNVRDALNGYTEYVDLQPDNNVLKRKSRIRIQKIKDEIAEKLLKKAQRLADDHNYEHCLKRLEQAYSLFPSKVITNKIVERYTTYSIKSIAWDLSSHSNLIKEKTVFIIPFISLSGNGSEQGKAVAGEIRNELINLRALEVYVRDDDTIKAILKEIEFGQSSGAIGEKTRKDLGKLVSTGAIVSGSIGYIADTLKINGWIINVETGKIVSAKSIKMLGWKIEDTDKSAGFNVNVWADRKVYTIGDMITINVTSNRDCFLTLLNVRCNGEIWELFPNRFNPDNFVKANVKYTFPSVQDNFGLTIVDPPGKEYIKAIATSTPITAEQISKILQDDQSLLITSADRIMRGSGFVFRPVSSSEMRGLHKILTRGVGILPGNNKLKYKAVSTWSFETRR